MSTGTAAARFPADILAQLGDGKSLRIHAGIGPHRFIGIWVVVVKGRVFVRSWSLRPDGWYEAFRTESLGAIRIAARDMPVVAAPIRDKRILDEIDRAYLDKYNTPGAIKYAKDLGSPRSRAATLELRPFHGTPKYRGGLTDAPIRAQTGNAHKRHSPKESHRNRVLRYKGASRERLED